MGWRVALSDEAEEDLGQVVRFLAQKDPVAAERIGVELIDLIFSLDHLPNRGAPVKRRPELRKIAHRHCLIVYRPNEAARCVEIVRIWDNRQDPKKLRLPK